MTLDKQSSSDVNWLFRALQIVSSAHKNQRRKYDNSPYINHLIEVANLVINVAKVSDVDIQIASLLHDILEDTSYTPDELVRDFGPRIANLVINLTDDKSLTLAERRAKQIADLPGKANDIKTIKLADHCSNISAIPESWSKERIRSYLEWSKTVAFICFDASPELAEEYKKRLKIATDGLDY